MNEASLPARSPLDRARAWSASAWAPPALLAVLSAVAVALLYRKGLGTTFYYDEWNFVMNRRGWDLETFLRPHNEHLPLVPAAIFKLLFVTVGLDDYWVYRVLLLIAHVVCVGLLFVIVRRRIGDWPAAAICTAVLFLGAAWNDLLVPFQISFLMSVAAGLGMLLALDRRDRTGDLAAGGFLAVALASSSVGAPFAAAALVDVLLRPDRLRRVWTLLVPIALYGAWSVVYGAPTATSPGLTLSDLVRQNLPGTPGYAATGVAAAFGALVGLGLDWGRPLALVGTGALAIRLARTPAPPRLLALLAAGLVYWGLAAIFRGHIGPPTDSRYIYFGAVLVVLIAAELLRPRLVGAQAGAFVAILVGAAALANFGPLRDGSRYLQEWSRFVRAELAALELAGPSTDPAFVPDPVRAPDITAGKYFDAVRDHGSPAATPAEIRRLDDPVRQAADGVLISALGVALRPREGNRSGPRPSVEAVVGGRVVFRPDCVRLVPLAAGATMDVRVPDGGLAVTSLGASPIDVRVRSFADTFPQTPLGPIAAGTTQSVSIPRRPGLTWHARVTASEPASACGLSES